jgi:hypothetical protein
MATMFEDRSARSFARAGAIWWVARSHKVLVRVLKIMLFETVIGPGIAQPGTERVERDLGRVGWIKIKAFEHATCLTTLHGDLG